MLMRIFARVLAFALKRLVFLLPRRDITRANGEPYLVRWYLFGEPGGLRYFPAGQDRPKWWQRALTWLPQAYVHQFLASDEPDLFHSHPWDGAISLILSGGYFEQRRALGDLVGVAGMKKRKTYVTTVWHAPGDVNRLDEDTLHRVELSGHWAKVPDSYAIVRAGDREAWTLFMPGKRTGNSWGFWYPKTDEMVPWREHVLRNGGTPVGPREVTS